MTKYIESINKYHCIVHNEYKCDNLKIFKDTTNKNKTSDDCGNFETEKFLILYDHKPLNSTESIHKKFYIVFEEKINYIGKNKFGQSLLSVTPNEKIVDIIKKSSQKIIKNISEPSDVIFNSITYNNNVCLRIDNNTQITINPSKKISSEKTNIKFNKNKDNLFYKNIFKNYPSINKKDDTYSVIGKFVIYPHVYTRKENDVTKHSIFYKIKECELKYCNSNVSYDIDKKIYERKQEIIPVSLVEL